MTYPQLLSSLYKAFDALHPLWADRMAKAGSLGAFVFLPADYAKAAALPDATYPYWNIGGIRDYVSGAHDPDPGFMDLLDDIDPEEMFLVMIVENPSAGNRTAVHIHKITRLGTN